VDGYVGLDGKPGLGRHLFDHLSQQVPVIGVAKTRCRGAPAIEVCRGSSQSPLYVSAVGTDVDGAAARVRRMHGPYRIPTLLKRVDRIARAGIRP
jgi:deoxyribonuclease V